MSLTTGGTVKFRTAMMGYQKADVDDYVARAESELDIQEKRREKWENEIEKQKKEIQSLNNILESERSERQDLQEKLIQMKREMESLREQLDKETKKNDALQNEYEDYQKRMGEEGADPKIIQEAFLNAQRMGDIVIKEAQQEALDIREKAFQEKQKQEEEGRKLVEDARAEARRITEEAKLEALRVTEEAEDRCDSLQKEYDRILMDVTGFKSEMMDMYRTHMELLAALPQKDIIE